MNRALRAATVGVLLLTPVALSACSSGQVNQTTQQVRDKTGPSARVGDLELRQVLIASPRGGQYSAGDDAEVTASIVNAGTKDDALVGISGDGFDSVVVTGTGTPSATSSAATTTAAAPASASGGRLNIPVPAQETVVLGQSAPTVTLTGLTEALTPAQHLKLTFTFENAGDVTIDVTVAAPGQYIPHTSSFNFEQASESQAASTEQNGG